MKESVHCELIRGESLEVVDRENLRETLPERLGLGLRSLADDSINDLMNILVDIVCRHSYVASTRLEARKLLSNAIVVTYNIPSVRYHNRER